MGGPSGGRMPGCQFQPANLAPTGPGHHERRDYAVVLEVHPTRDLRSGLCLGGMSEGGAGGSGTRWEFTTIGGDRDRGKRPAVEERAREDTGDSSDSLRWPDRSMEDTLPWETRQGTRGAGLKAHLLGEGSQIVVSGASPWTMLGRTDLRLSISGGAEDGEVPGSMGHQRPNAGSLGARRLSAVRLAPFMGSIPVQVLSESSTESQITPSDSPNASISSEVAREIKGPSAVAEARGARVVAAEDGYRPPDPRDIHAPLKQWMADRVQAGTDLAHAGGTDAVTGRKRDLGDIMRDWVKELEYTRVLMDEAQEARKGKPKGGNETQQTQETSAKAARQPCRSP